MSQKYEHQPPDIFVYDFDKHLLRGAFAIRNNRVYYGYVGGRFGTISRKARREKILLWRCYANPSAACLSLLYENPDRALKVIRELTEATGRFTWDKFLVAMEPPAHPPLRPYKPREDGHTRISLEQQGLK